MAKTKVLDQDNSLLCDLRHGTIAIERCIAYQEEGTCSCEDGVLARQEYEEITLPPDDGSEPPPAAPRNSNSTGERICEVCGERKIPRNWPNAKHCRFCARQAQLAKGGAPSKYAREKKTKKEDDPDPRGIQKTTTRKLDGVTVHEDPLGNIVVDVGQGEGSIIHGSKFVALYYILCDIYGDRDFD